MPIVKAVEHVLLLKLKRPSQPQMTIDQREEEMLQELNALRSISGVLHLKAGPILCLWPAHRVLNGGYTHVMHCRFQDKAALAAFSLHPAQIYTMDKYVLPLLDSLEGLAVVNWESSIEKHVDQFFEAKRIVLCRLEDGVCCDGRKKLLEEITDSNRSAKFVSAGDNFTPVQARGIDFGHLSFFRKLDEVQNSGNNPEILLNKMRTSAFARSVVMVDYANETGKEWENSPLAEPPVHPSVAVQ